MAVFCLVNEDQRKPMYNKTGERRGRGMTTETRDKERQSFPRFLQVFSLWFYSMRVSFLGFCITALFLDLLILYARVRILITCSQKTPQ